MSDERDERDERGKRDDRDERGERREERRALRLAAISMRCRPNFVSHVFHTCVSRGLYISSCSILLSNSMYQESVLASQVLMLLSNTCV